MAFPSLNNSAPNFPPPVNRHESSDKYTFPTDLMRGGLDKGKSLYTQIQLVNYSIIYQQNSQVSSYSIPSGGAIKLPVPTKLNDNLVLNWSTPSLVDIAGSVVPGLSALVKLGNIGGAAWGNGVAVNPLMFLQFQRPEFRQFTLSWVLTARNKKESDNIKNIITKLKQSASPTNMGLLMGYPQVAIVKMQPDNIFGSMIFKPCVITSVMANYTGGPNPSFFKSGAPTVVTLTVNLMEMQFWFRDEIT